MPPRRAFQCSLSEQPKFWRSHRLTFATLHVAFGNVSDYDTNFAFIQHVLSMDTIFERSTIRYRAITDPTLQRAALCGHYRGG